MATRTARLTRGLLAALGLGFASPLPAAHPLPLHRHALEQSTPASYEVLLFHRGELTPDAEARRAALEDARSRSQANATLRLIDLDGPLDPAASSLWLGQASDQAEPPWLVVRAPDSASNTPPAWAGPLNAPLVQHLFDSPARTRIVEGLLRGATAMWILLECGEAVRDEAAVDRLTSSLRALEKQLKPPSRRGSQSPLPLRIDFGLVRVTRSDPAEEFLVQLLEHGAPAPGSRPLAFAVFGRGRLVGPLSGRDLDLEGIRDMCQKLIAPPAPGPSKAPGRDLLLGADWRRVFQPSPTPPSTGVPGQPAPVSADDGPGRSPRLSWMHLAAGAALLTAAGAALRARRRRHR